MKRGDERNLTPARALPLLRSLDEHHRQLVRTSETNGLAWVLDRVREALDGHVRYGLARAKRRATRKASR